MPSAPLLYEVASHEQLPFRPLLLLLLLFNAISTTECKSGGSVSDSLGRRQHILPRDQIDRKCSAKDNYQRIGLKYVPWAICNM